MKNLKLYEVYGLNVVLKMYVLQSHKRQKNCHDGRNHKSTGWTRPPCRKKVCGRRQRPTTAPLFVP